VGQYCNRALALPGLLAPALEIAVGASAALILFYGVTLLLGFPEARRLRGFALRSLGQLRFANR
jgi:hypothetical protein